MHVIGEVGGDFANFYYWGSRSDFANCRRKTCPKTRENAGITSFSRLATEEDELRAHVEVRGFLPRENFLYILALLVQNFLMKNP